MIHASSESGVALDVEVFVGTINSDECKGFVGVDGGEGIVGNEYISESD